MVLRPLLSLSVLLVALLAGCSDGPPSGDLQPIAGSLSVDGSTSMNTYVAESGGIPNPGVPAGPSKLCPEGVPTVNSCVAPSSHYKIHFMSLPEPDGNGYAIFQVGGTIGERSLVNLLNEGGDMWGAEHTTDSDQRADFDQLELRMGSFKVATASSAEGSQAFVVNPLLAGVTVTGSYKGKTLTVDVQGLPEGPNYVGRLYTQGTSGNLTVAESFPIVAGEQSFTSKLDNIGAYSEFHIHVGTSKIYVYQATL